MPQTPTVGQPYTARISGVLNPDNLRCTVGGSVRYPTIRLVDAETGTYDVEFDGSDITCPGPVLITEKVNGAEIERHNAAVSGCP